MAQKQKHYTLYADESETGNELSGKKHFCMAGAVIQNHDYGFVQDEVNKLKSDIWEDLEFPEQIILHQKNVTAAAKGRLDIVKFPEYERFRSKSFRKRFYSELAGIFDCGKIWLTGGSVDVHWMEQYYNISQARSFGKSILYRNQTNKYLITLQVLMENYCHFLFMNQGTGWIVYEYINETENEKISAAFYQIKFMGTMYITKEVMSRHLSGIRFVKKKENHAGLQMADFIPNAFARNHAGFKQTDGDDIYIRKMKYYRYGGQSADQDWFGIRYIP